MITRIDITLNREAEARRARHIAVGLIALVAIVVATVIRCIPCRDPYVVKAPDGAAVTVTDSWPNLFELAIGSEPNHRRQEFSDGTVMEGPLHEGEKHGPWSIRKDGDVIDINFWFGTATGPVPDSRIQIRLAYP